MKTIQLLAVIIAIAGALLLISSTSSQIALADTKMLSSGDFGCKTASIDNLRNIGQTGIPFLGLGDYMYNCNPGDIEEDQLLDDYYASITDKVGAMGNHEIEKGQHEQWARDTFQNPNGYSAWRLSGNNGELGIIILDPYQKFDEGSKQYNFVLDKVNKFQNEADGIDWIVFALHEPLWTPTAEGGHGPNTALRETYAPIIQSLDNAFLIQAHNHVSGFGNVEGVNQAICGGGGYAGDNLGKLNGWEWATDKMGFCSFDFKSDSIAGDFVNTEGDIVKHFVWNRSP